METDIQKILEEVALLFNDDGGESFLQTQFKEVQLAIFIEKLEDKDEKYKKVYSYIKKINRDFKNIGIIIERIEWLKSIALEKKEIYVSWHRYVSVDIEHFHTEIRSIMDYVAQTIGLLLPNGGQLPDSFRKLCEWTNKNSSRIDSSIESIIKYASSWFMNMRSVRDDIVHYGASTIVFNGPQDGILFQIYNSQLDKKIDNEKIIMFNENIAFFDKYAALYISRVLYSIKELSKALVSIISSSNVTDIESSNKSEIGINMLNSFTRISDPGFKVIKNWITDLLENFALP
ncbi:MAG TPA: hypothetical protein VIS94_13995 [Desulfomonilia bacterium]